MLDLAKIEARKLELYPGDVYFPALLEGIAEMMRVRANQKGIAFTYQPDSDLPTGITVDEKRLRSIGHLSQYYVSMQIIFRLKRFKHFLNLFNLNS
ncbi:hypothetical protein WA1_09930 [Scytonema hofmannii PCC 7110]|uniref:Uncharacterized protein n=1 Tax=Scytonema hofmannii PCC 7110 TaxID=128403 RepID=A0A139WRH9_9CYAN|nr:hypothetical protein WA1_09930 [Scytonema hofmannii PCC 7110]